MRTSTMMTHHRHGTVFPKIYLNALWMSIISGGEFGSWGKTPFTCNLLRLNAFYMQIYPGQLARMRRHRTPSSFLWFIMSLLYSVCPMIDAILGMLRVLRNFRCVWNLNIYDQRSCIYGAEIFMILLHKIIPFFLFPVWLLTSICFPQTCFLRRKMFLNYVLLKDIIMCRIFVVNRKIMQIL